MSSRTSSWSAPRWSSLLRRSEGGALSADLPPARSAHLGRPLDGEQKLRMVLEGGNDPSDIAALCQEHGLSEADFYQWRETARVGAARALEQAVAPVLVS